MTGLLGSPIAWLAASLALYGLVTNAAWYVVEAAPERLPGPAARRAARWLYLAGVPIAALAARLPASPAQLGLAWPERPLAALALALLLGAATAAMVRAAPGAKALRVVRPHHVDGRALANEVGVVLADALALALHAAFVRSVVLGAGIGLGHGDTGGAPGMVATLALLAIEALLDPWTRHAVATPAPPPDRLVRGAARNAVDAAAFALWGSLATTLVARLAVESVWRLTSATRLDGAAATIPPADRPTAKVRPAPEPAADRSIEPTIV